MQAKLIESAPLLNSILSVLEDPKNGLKNINKQSRTINKITGKLVNVNKNKGFSNFTCNTFIYIRTIWWGYSIPNTAGTGVSTRLVSACSIRSRDRDFSLETVKSKSHFLIYLLGSNQIIFF